MVSLTHEEIRAAVRAALAEDVGSGDVTTLACIREDAMARARMVAREAMVVAGAGFADAAFREMSPEMKVVFHHGDGRRVASGGVILEVAGPARGLLTAERVALNFVQRLSGVATLTARFVSEVAGTGARILDTRKTTPGWRRFEKHAVVCGGGWNHRMGLYDRVLIKDNHLAAIGGDNPIAEAVARARRLYPGLKIEVEADTVAQAAQAAEAGADIVLLDNMSLDQLREAVRVVGGRAVTEASGGVRLDTVRRIGETGVNDISVGAITHSAPSVDIGLDFVE